MPTEEAASAISTANKQVEKPLQIQYELYDNISADKDGGLLEGVKLALKNRLYVPASNYCLREELQELRQHATTYKHDRIALAKDTSTGKYVCCIYLKFHHLQSFTRKAYRKRGIARATITRMGQLPKEVYAMDGIEGSYKFWEKVGINAV